MTLKRNDKIKVTKFNKGYTVSNDNNVVLGATDDYFIYFKNVTFQKDGTIDGRYLGQASDTLIDGYCRTVDFTDNGWIQEDGKSVKTARMVALNNQTGATIIIQSN